MVKKCEHNVNYWFCRKCPGPGICEHDTRRNTCKKCEGSSICEHKNRRSKCKECPPELATGLCVHRIDKEKCKECDGTAFCECGERKERCLKCGGSGLCLHQIRKEICRKCDGSAFCKHGLFSTRCKICNGRDLCKSEWCDTRANCKHYEGYCSYCFYNLFPDKPVTRNFKTKERSVIDFIKENFLDFEWIKDKKIVDGISVRRPDLLLDMTDFVIVSEIDENQHKPYETLCENKRLMEISQDLKHRPLIVIRFNPDGYKNKNKEIIKSCWEFNDKNCLKISNKGEWDKRLNLLKERINYWINNGTTKTIEIDKLFYDEIEED